MNKNTALFEKIKKEILSSPKEKLLCISTTANLNNPPIFVGSIRETDTTIAGNIIIRDTSILDEVVACFDGEVEYFLVDCEIKNEVKNLETLILKKVKKSRVFVYKPNDFTVESLDTLLAIVFQSLRDKKVLIVGAGNIGSKVAIKLCERGAKVFVCDTDIKKNQIIVDGLNLIKRSDRVITAVEMKDDLTGGIDLILGCTPGIPAVTKEMVKKMNKEAKIIDVGNGTIQADAITSAQENSIEVLCLSSFGGYIGMISNWLFQRKIFNKKRRKILGQNDLITIGVFGKRGDIIVDDVDNPEKLIGVCDGKGDILSKEETAVIFKDFFSQTEDKKVVFQIKKLYAKIQIHE